jgi:hypothetical protein
MPLPQLPPGRKSPAAAQKNAAQHGGTRRRSVFTWRPLSAEEITGETKNIIPHTQPKSASWFTYGVEREPNKMRRPGLEATERRKDLHLSPEGWRATAVYQEEPPQTEQAA